MSIKTCTKRNIEALNNAVEIKNLGCSMLYGKKAEIKITDTDEVPVLKRRCTPDENAFLGCVGEDVTEHIDILSDTADIVCDLGAVTSAEAILIRSCFNSSINYSLAEFELYAGDTRDNLFAPENMIAHERGIDNWHKGERNNSDWIYDIEGSLRYLGIRVLKANGTDDIIRLGHVGIYNSRNTEGKKYMSEKYSHNLLEGMEPISVTDGAIFNTDLSVDVSGERTFDFAFDGPKKSLKLWTVVSGDVSVDAGEDFSLEKVSDIPYGRKEYFFSANENKSIEKISVTCKGNGFVEQIGADTVGVSVSVDSDKVIIEDFLGIGADHVPSQLMKEGLELGYNDVYWELDKCRIEKVKPHVVRLWFQLDWIVTEYEKYKNCNLDFETEKMQAVYRYLDLFKANGTEVELNYAWKFADPVPSWFAFDELPEIDNGSFIKRTSAPKELDLFANSCGKLMHELIVNRGYTNIKYVTFYNESNCSDNPEHYGYDFAVPHGMIAKEYYADMLKLCKESLLKYGLDDLEIWGFELTDHFAEWAECVKDKYGDIVDRYSIHFYQLVSDENAQRCAAKEFKRGSYYTDRPVVLTECGQVYNPENYNFNMNHIQLFCDAVNNGISGLLIWCLHSVRMTKPSDFLMRNGIDMWDALQCHGAIDNVRGSFYEFAPLARYVPNHCKAVKAVVEDKNRFFRTCAFKTDEGDMTVVLEADNGMTDRNVDIKFNTNVNKPFYKFVYKRPSIMNGNALFPSVSKVIYAEDSINDTIDGDYQAIIYTTLPPVTQIAVCANEIFLEPKESRYLTASVIDGDGGIDWKILASTDDAFELMSDSTNSIALVKAKEDAKKGSMVAIEAKSRKKPDARNVIIVKIR